MIQCMNPTSEKKFACITFEYPSGISSIQYHHDCECGQRQEHDKNLHLVYSIHFTLQQIRNVVKLS